MCRALAVSEQQAVSARDTVPLWRTHTRETRCVTSFALTYPLTGHVIHLDEIEPVCTRTAALPLHVISELRNRDLFETKSMEYANKAV